MGFFGLNMKCTFVPFEEFITECLRRMVSSSWFSHMELLTLLCLLALSSLLNLLSFYWLFYFFKLTFIGVWLLCNVVGQSVHSLSRVWLCNPMNRSMPVLPVHHQIPEFTETHVIRVGDVIQPSNPLSSPSPPAPNPSQHQGLLSQLLASGGQSTGVSASASVLPMNTQDWSLGWTGWIFLQSKGLSRVFSNTTVQKHQFFNA